MTKTTAGAERWRRMNDPVIAEFRANVGTLKRRQHPVILLTTTGRKSRQPRVTPLNFSVDGDRLVVIGSAGGSPSHPAWYLNLVASPEVTIEHVGEMFRARVSTAEEPEPTRLFDRQVAVLPFFGGYRKRVTTRQIPVVVFERLG